MERHYKRSNDLDEILLTSQDNLVSNNCSLIANQKYKQLNGKDKLLTSNYKKKLPRSASNDNKHIEIGLNCSEITNTLKNDTIVPDTDELQTICNNLDTKNTIDNFSDNIQMITSPRTIDYNDTYNTEFIKHSIKNNTSNQIDKLLNKILTTYSSKEKGLDLKVIKEHYTKENNYSLDRKIAGDLSVMNIFKKKSLWSNTNYEKDFKLNADRKFNMKVNNIHVKKNENFASHKKLVLKTNSVSNKNVSKSQK